MGNNGYDLTVNVMMVGGRRCGKTSVLSAMQSCFEEKLVGTPLVISPADDEMLDVLEKKHEEMNQYFANKGKTRDFVPNNNATTEASEYPFAISIKGKEARICVNFADYPGEWWKSKEKGHAEQIKSFLKHSSILLIAIDTPHLMEKKGIYNDAQNRCQRISQMIKMERWADKHKSGMVLFVPLKCERYYNDDQMGEVNQRVQEAYAPLLQYLQQPNADNKASLFTVAITPIFTLGGAAFNRFKRDESGEIIIDQEFGTPKEPLYYFPDMTKNAPEPKYCEQPLLYVLDYVLGQAEYAKRRQKEGNVWDKLFDWFQRNLLNWPSAEDYLTQKEAIQEQIKQRGEGYSILNKGTLKL